MINLEKGQKISLEKTAPGLKKVMVGLGWDVNTTGGADFDLDAEAFIVKESNVSELIYYGHLNNATRSIVHQGDNLTGAGDGDDEQILVDLEKLTAENDVKEVIFTVTIYKASERGQNFGQVSNAYIRIVDNIANTEICKYDLSEDYSTSKSVIVGRLYRHNGEWKVEATGVGEHGELQDLLTKYNAQ